MDEADMRYAVVGGKNETLARSRSSEGAHRASRRQPIAAVSSVRVVEMNRASSIGTILATRAGQSAVFRPKGYLGDSFNTYRNAMGTDARYDREAQANVGPVRSAGGVVARLQAAGFAVEVAPDLAEAIAAAGTAPIEEAPRDLISATLSGQTAVFEPKSYLGRDKFNVFREAIQGARYDGKVNRAPLPVSVGIIARLQKAGFAVSLDPELAAALKAIVSQVDDDVEAGKRRAEELDARLREKGLSLFGYQKDGVAWLSGRFNAMLFDEQGTGKTIQTLVSLPAGAPVVVVCPAVVKGVWRNEAAKWRPEFKVTILSGRNSFRWPAPGEIVVTNYDVLSDEVGAAPPGTVVIGDEVQAVKAGTKVKRGARFRALTKAARDSGGRSWGLSGTPLLNRPPELWNILMAFGLAEEAFGSWKQFVATFDGTPGEWGGFEWGTPRPDAAEKIGKVSLRRMRKDVLPDLPTKVYQDVPVELGAKEKKAIDKALRDAGLSVEDVLAAIEQAEQGRFELPDFTKLSAARAALASAKIPALLEMVEGYEESEEPIVVFSSHRAPIDVLGERPGWATITGDVTPEKRSEIVAAFQAGKLKGVALTIKAGGTGVTLTRASTSIFVDQDWTPGNNEQAQDRICRIGQTRGCNYKLMVADHAIDERVYELLAKKRRIIDASVDASTTMSAKDSHLEDVDFDALTQAARAEIEQEQAIEKVRGEVRERRRVAAIRRSARNDAERHAETALQQLAMLDPDAAYERNDVGFSKFDATTGHWIANEVVAGHGLTDNQWRLAVGLAYKYRRQTGDVPVDTKGKWFVEPSSGTMVRALTAQDVIARGIDPDAESAEIEGKRYLLVDGYSYSARR